MTQEQVETHLTDLVKQGKIKEQGLDYIITIDLSLYDRKNNKWTDVQPVDFTLTFLYYCNDIMGSIFLEEISDSGKLNTLSIDGHLNHRLQNLFFRQPPPLSGTVANHLWFKKNPMASIGCKHSDNYNC